MENYIKPPKLPKAGEDEWNAINARGRLEEEWSRFPTGCQAVPMSDPNWSADEGDNNNWHRNHFITCIVEGLKASWVKPVKNYQRFTRGTRGSISFLRKTGKALRKHTPRKPETMECWIILKDKLIAQSVPDIWRKLQKLAFGPDQDLKHLLE